MKTFKISVQFDLNKTYKIRAKDAKEAAEILDERVINTMTIHHRDFTNPHIMTTSITKGESSFDEEISINEFTKVCDY